MGRARARERPRLVTRPFALIILVTFAYFVSVNMVLPILPLFVKRRLNGGDVAVGIAVGAFSFTAFVLRPWAGRLGDRHGRRLLILFGTVVVAISVAGYAASTSLGVLVLFRLLSGVGEAFFFVGAASAVNDMAPDDRRGEAISLFSLGLYAGIAIGPLIGEAVLRERHFHAVWFVAAAFTAAGAGLAAIIHDTLERQPVAQKQRLIHPAAFVPGTVLLANVWGFAGYSAFVALYARSLGLSGAGPAFATYAGIVLAVRSFGARLPDIFGPRRTARAALLSNAAGLMVIGLWNTVTGLFVGTAVFAIGQALAFPALMTLAVAGAPTSERGSVVGTFTAFFDLSFGVGAISLGAVAHAFGYSGTFLGGAAAAIVGFIVLVTSTRRVTTR